MTDLRTRIDNIYALEQDWYSSVRDWDLQHYVSGFEKSVDIIRSLEAKVEELDKLLEVMGEALDKLALEAGRDYCKALQNAEDYPNLKGEQWKIDNGEFKLENLQAHKDNCRLLGRHFGIMYSVNSLRPLLAQYQSYKGRE